MPEARGYYLLGGPTPTNNFRTFCNGKMAFARHPMPIVKNFFAAVYYDSRVFVFGGYDVNVKQ